MEETFEFRINYDYATRLFDATEGKDLGQVTKSVKVVKITKDDPRFDRIPVIDSEIKERFGRAFFYSWRIDRKYSKKELETAFIFNLNIKTIFYYFI